MRALRVLVLTVLTMSVLGATAFGAGYAVREYGGASRAASRADAVPDRTPDEPVPTPSPEPSATPPADPGPVLEPGATGEQVRELQHRLFQLAWWPELTTGTYDGATRDAVAGFQAKRGLRSTGTVDRRTWDLLVSMTDTPTRDQLLNVLKPGPALFERGDTGEGVRGIQARLIQVAWLSGDVTGTYDAATVAAVEGFQAKREIPVTGAVDQRTLDRLAAMTHEPSYEERHNIRPKPGALDPRCRTGRALCVDKTTQSLRWVVDGAVLKTVDVRFGSSELPTREGAFSVFQKSRDHVSSLYDTPMPYAMFFSGGQAVHYSPDFAANGYNGASHGCVNVRDHDAISWLYDQVQIGDKVIVYWS